MKSIIIIFTAIVLVFFVAVTFIFPQEDLRNHIVFFYDLVLEAGTVFILARYCFLN